MEWIWSILELEPTTDRSAIRQAYARKANDCHPDEDSEELLRLKQALQAAFDYAKANGRSSGPAFGNEAEPNGTRWPAIAEPPEMGENPFRGGEAIRQFEALYTGRQRKNSKLWMEYVTSGAFLDAAWDRRFTALLLETVTAAEQPPSKEFIQWLCAAYQLTVRWDERPAPDGSRQMEPSLQIAWPFDGQESIFGIAFQGPIPKPPKHNELAILHSFLDYRHLVGLAEQGTWDEQAVNEFKWIAGRYSSAYIKERCEQRTSPDCERHPAGLRVFLHFFQREDLPEELYRIVWDRFDLKNAIMGRSKVLYGRLRELVAERVPGISEEKPENFFQINLDRDACYARIKAHPESEAQETAAYFAGEAIQTALHSRRFIEEQLLSYGNWLNMLAPEGVVRWLREYYRTHPEIPGWDRVVERAEDELQHREEKRRAAERQGWKEVSSEDLELTLLTPESVYVQPLAGPERAYRPKGWDSSEEESEGEWAALEEKSDSKFDWPLPPEDLAALEEKSDSEFDWPLPPEDLAALFAQFAQGKLARLEISMCAGVLVLAHSGDRYACFYFEHGYDTWYTMLSQPEVYQTIDCKDVVYAPFGMGRLASYNIHESAASIFRNLNLAFQQLRWGRPQVREGDCWLWSSDTYQFNSEHKKRMAMQKLAGIPACRASGYILAKFVFSQYPSQTAHVTLEGKRSFYRLQPGNYGLAANELVQFVQKKLAKLRLTWTLPTPEGGMEQRHIVLLQDNGQFMMVWLQDAQKRASLYTADSPRTFQGRVYPACPVHLDLKRIRNCLDLMLDDMSCVELVTDRPGEFIPVDSPYEQIRTALLTGDEELG